MARGRGFFFTVVEQEALRCALAFCLAGDEIFLDDAGEDDDDKVRAAQVALDKLNRHLP